MHLIDLLVGAFLTDISVRILQEAISQVASKLMQTLAMTMVMDTSC
jgi:hypothetical protein